MPILHSDHPSAGDPRHMGLLTPEQGQPHSSLPLLWLPVWQLQQPVRWAAVFAGIPTAGTRLVQQPCTMLSWLLRLWPLAFHLVMQNCSMPTKRQQPLTIQQPPGPMGPECLFATGTVAKDIVASVTLLPKNFFNIYGLILTCLHQIRPFIRPLRLSLISKEPMAAPYLP